MRTICCVAALFLLGAPATAETPADIPSAISVTGEAQISVPPVQRPHPPLWMMSRDPQTLEFFATNAISPGYFLVYPRADAAPRYRQFLADWQRAGHAQRPNIAYCTVVYVDETDDKAIETALLRASRAYEGFLKPPKPGESFEERAREHARMFVGRGEPGASEIMQDSRITASILLGFCPVVSRRRDTRIPSRTSSFTWLRVSSCS